LKIIFAGGGTAGHINPALAIANYILRQDKTCEILFVGTKRGMESTLVPKAGFNIEYIEAQGFKRSISAKNIQAVFTTYRGYLKSKKIIKKFKPDIVVGTGGYVSGPVLAAAAKMNVPTVIHEQNVFPGMTSKILSKMVDAVCISFAESKKVFEKAKKTVFTGNPLRPEILEVSYDDARKKLGIGDEIFITAFGGSLGADKINNSVLELVKKCGSMKNIKILLSTGRTHFEETKEMFSQNGITEDTTPQFEIVPYIDNMPDVMSAADLVIGRSGAITVSEITALGKASVLIPSPNVTDNHQEYNAKALADNGAAVMLREAELTDGAFTDAVVKIIGNKSNLKKMSENSAKIGIKDGTAKIKISALAALAISVVKRIEGGTAMFGNSLICCP